MVHQRNVIGLVGLLLEERLASSVDAFGAAADVRLPTEEEDMLFPDAIRKTNNPHKRHGLIGARHRPAAMNRLGRGFISGTCLDSSRREPRARRERMNSSPFPRSRVTNLMQLQSPPTTATTPGLLA